MIICSTSVFTLCIEMAEQNPKIAVSMAMLTFHGEGLCYPQHEKFPRSSQVFGLNRPEGQEPVDQLGPGTV